MSDFKEIRALRELIEQLERQVSYYRRALTLVAAPVPPECMDGTFKSVGRILYMRLEIANRALRHLRLEKEEAPADAGAASGEVLNEDRERESPRQEDDTASTETPQALSEPPPGSAGDRAPHLLELRGLFKDLDRDEHAAEQILKDL